MNSERYEILLKVIEAGSFSAAAEELNYTPSGMSRLVGELENECGFRLLYRSKTGVVPTPECQSILPAVRDFIRSAAALDDRMHAISGIETGEITVGTAYPFFYEAIAACVRVFRKKYPGITVHIVNDSSESLSRKITSHELDLALISRREGKFLWYPLFEDRLVAWLPEDGSVRGNSYAEAFADSGTPAGGDRRQEGTPSHGHQRHEGIRAEAFADLDYIDIFPGGDTDNTRYFSRCRVTPNTVYTTKDLMTAYKLVSAGFGAAVNNALNSRELGKGVKTVPLIPEGTVEIGLAVTSEASARAGLFAQELLSILRAEQSEKNMKKSKGNLKQNEEK